jgi:polyhydroxybutyrate depolymerase
MIRALILSGLTLLASQAVAQTRPASVQPGSPCHGQTACDLDGRVYHVKEPDGWDGVTPLPVLLHFHGWARTGAGPVYNGRVSGATRRRGVLLLAPTGINKTWSFRRSESEDVAFANAVIADAASRYPIDNIRSSSPVTRTAVSWHGDTLVKAVTA